MYSPSTTSITRATPAEKPSAGVAVALLILFTPVLAAGQVLPPGLVPVQTYTASALNLTTPMSGCTFDLTGANFLMSSYSSGVSTLPVTRDPQTGSITGFGTPTPHVVMSNLDGGLDFGPSGTLFWSVYPNHQLGQLAPGGGMANPSLTPTGVPPSAGGLEFVPAGFANAGELLVASHDAGGIYKISLTPNPNGTFTPVSGSAVLFLQQTPGLEGMRHLTTGPYAGSMLVCNYNNSEVRRVALDPATGLPALSPSGQPQVTPFITNFSGAFGMAVDPVTGDLFISTWNAGHLIRHYTWGAAALTLGGGGSTIGGAAPTLSANQAPSLGSYGFAVSVAATAGTDAFLFGSIGISSTPWTALPGCPLYLEPTSMLSLVAAGVLPLGPQPLGAGGSTSFALPIPNDPAFTGLLLGLQAAVIVPASPFGIDITDAVGLYIR
jgi:hypothetical protein